MNRNIRTLIAALPLAAAALAFTPGTASADGPVIVMPSGGGDPKPMDIATPTPAPDPQPNGPGDVTNPTPGPTPPHGPGDIAVPDPEPTHPDGPGDLTAPEPCPTHGVDCSPGDEPKDDDEPQGGEKVHHPATVHHSVVTPTRVHAGLTGAQAPTEHGGPDLALLLAGGAGVVALGAAAARKRARA